MRGGDEADAAETAATGLDHRLQHLFDRRTQRQIGVADDAGADLRLAVSSGRGHRRDPVGELDFADRAQLGRTLGAVHRQPFEVDGRGDVVAAFRASVAGADGVRRSFASLRATGVGEKVRQQIAPGLRPVDQVVMRVDDRQFGLDDRLAAPVEPVLPDRQMRADRGSRCRRLHGLLSPYPEFPWW
jgi:hypothetical protein